MNNILISTGTQLPQAQATHLPFLKVLSASNIAQMRMSSTFHASRPTTCKLKAVATRFLSSIILLEVSAHCSDLISSEILYSNLRWVTRRGQTILPINYRPLQSWRCADCHPGYRRRKYCFPCRSHHVRYFLVRFPTNFTVSSISSWLGISQKCSLQFQSYSSWFLSLEWESFAGCDLKRLLLILKVRPGSELVLLHHGLLQRSACFIFSATVRAWELR